MDYDFWIQATVRLLCLKRKGVSSWAEAARAFNGSGPDAETYKAEVTARMKADRKSTRLNSSHESTSRMPSSA